MDRINFQSRVTKLNSVLLSKLFKECTPKILVVTDGLNYDPTEGFGLTVFVNTLSAMTLHGMTPMVTTALRGGSSPLANISDFAFDDKTHGVLTSRYDIVFIFSSNTTTINPVSQSEIDAIASFMQAGGGVFATGDHEDLGASIGLNIPRVRSMRFWSSATTPHVSNEHRLSTNISGTDETEEFSDQSDRFPQRLYPNYRTSAGGSGMPHPLLQMPAPARVIEVFPDHPHEGECTVPTNLATDFVLEGNNVPEWPTATDGSVLPPEIVARSMSYGDGFPGGPTGPKDPLEPRAFISICAWDGHRAGRGRVVTDATWHHFININLDGTGSGLPAGLAGLATAELDRVKQYYRNLAAWLMPKNVRRCLRFPLIVEALGRYPLIEELDLPRPPEWTTPVLRHTGETVVAALRARHPQWVVDALLSDALADAGNDVLHIPQANSLDRLIAKDAALTAFGGFVGSVAALIEASKTDGDLAPHGRLEKESAVGARTGLKLFLVDKQREIEGLSKSIRSLNVI